jgi:hypothetical protein
MVMLQGMTIIKIDLPGYLYLTTIFFTPVWIVLRSIFLFIITSKLLRKRRYGSALLLSVYHLFIAGMTLICWYLVVLPMGGHVPDMPNDGL